MITLFWTVFFCLGWRIVTDEGQILYFIRKPFEKAYDDMDVLNERMKLFGNFQPEKTSVDALKRSLRKHKLIVTIGKPLVLCITCMASIWGCCVFIALNGLNKDLVAPLILNCFSAAFIQTFIWSLYAKHVQ